MPANELNYSMSPNMSKITENRVKIRWRNSDKNVM